jgi:hypothetical protein
MIWEHKNFACCRVTGLGQFSPLRDFSTLGIFFFHNLGHLFRIKSFRSRVSHFSWCNIPKRKKCTKWPLNIPNGHYIYPMAVKYVYQMTITFANTAKPSKIYPDWNIWFENICTIWQSCFGGNWAIFPPKISGRAGLLWQQRVKSELAWPLTPDTLGRYVHRRGRINRNAQMFLNAAFFLSNLENKWQ